MKRCPTCNRTYTDDALSFCLDDGGRLLTESAGSPSYDPNATVQYSQPRDTSGEPPPTQIYQPNAPVYQQPAQPSWSPTPTYPQAAPKKRSPWPWILGGGVLLLVLGVGFVVLIVALASMSTNNNNNANANNGNTKVNRNSNTNTANANNSNTNSNTSASTFTDDFSTQKWWIGSDASLTANYEDGEYHMKGVAERYVVQYAPENASYYTKNATVRATARSISGTSPKYGYGISVLGQNKDNKLQDYSFIIYTANNPQYSVVFHQGGKETTIVSWTPSNTIRTGTSTNQLEVRLSGKQMAFYINGQYATSINDTYNLGDGLAGFYTSDTPEVAFDDLEISK
ncbi:MAG: hypothetical protein WBP93_02775 [Pyrinomonadaceae bacterium]